LKSEPERHIIQAQHMTTNEKKAANMIIRDERPGDIEEISWITRTAFEVHPYGVHTEQYIIRELRDSRVLTISLVAEMEGKVVGHITFSPVRMADCSPDWYGVGPVSVLPHLQRRGIGTALVYRGLELPSARGANGCVLVGDPEYYTRFGFKNIPGLVH